MKISIILISFILCLTRLNSFKILSPYSQLSNIDITNFLEKVKISSNNEKKTNMKMIYDTQIAIIKETDQAEDKPIKFDVQMELSRESINIFEKNRIKNRISYLDFFFLDGVVLFDDLSFFQKIHTIIYTDIMRTLRPKIEKYAKEFGVERFNKYCFFAIRSKFRDATQKQLGMIYTSIIFCLSSSYEDIVLNKFSADFVQNYQIAITEEEDFNKIQQYRLKQNIMIQYYDPNEKMDIDNPHLPNFFTSFSKEGLVLNEKENYDPKHVRYSFRFDQVIQCGGDEASSLKQTLHPKISQLFKPDECCISYLVDWNQKGVKNMFCSMYGKPWRCKVDIKIFQSTLHHYCLEQQVEKIMKLKKKDDNIGNLKMYLLERASVISALTDIDKINLSTIWDNVSYFYQIVDSQKKIVKFDLYRNLKAFDGEISTNIKYGGCQALIDRNDLSKQISADDKYKVFDGEKKTLGNTDFESSNGAQKKDKYNPSNVSLQNIENLKLKFCREMKKMMKDDDNIQKKYEEDKKRMYDKVPEENEENKKKKNIFLLIGKIRVSMGKSDFSSDEIKRISELVMNYPDITEKILRFNIELPKDLLTNILKSSTQDSVRILRGFVEQKEFILNHEPDPTHKGSTLPCSKNGDSNKNDSKIKDLNDKNDDKNNKDKDNKNDNKDKNGDKNDKKDKNGDTKQDDKKDPADNKGKKDNDGGEDRKEDENKDPKHKEEPKEDEINLPNPIDDPSGYLDDSDYYSISGKSIDIENINAESKKSKKSLEIIVPRIIPKIKKESPPSPPKPEIPVREPLIDGIPDDEEPIIPFQNTNPGTIKKDDENAIREIINHSHENKKLDLINTNVPDDLKKSLSPNDLGNTKIHANYDKILSNFSLDNPKSKNSNEKKSDLIHTNLSDETKKSLTSSDSGNSNIHANYDKIMSNLSLKKLKSSRVESENKYMSKDPINSNVNNNQIFNNNGPKEKNLKLKYHKN